MDEYGSEYGYGYGTATYGYGTYEGGASYGYGYAGEYGAGSYGAESYDSGYGSYSYDTQIPGYDANPMGLPSVADLNQMANQAYDQTTATLDGQVAQMNEQYAAYGQTIDTMNQDGRYDGILAQADQADAQMAYGYQQYGNSVSAQTNAESWEQAGAQSYWVGQGL
ncbi:hypothetical protein GIS00_02650 [Nakamurella sp. YIM 132087]|uniref:Uncharacterized protein n=1 Tax=Nakamurella alba TaxID=2665158 RepID=A0A7K1FIX3_9ACTN|nr:hypothetical protein [Nakamurella alba]MTD12844.1 hypothetical protein [Nakamurella alba]